MYNTLRISFVAHLCDILAGDGTQSVKIGNFLRYHMCTGRLSLVPSHSRADMLTSLDPVIQLIKNLNQVFGSCQCVHVVNNVGWDGPEIFDNSFLVNFPTEAI